MSFGFLQIVLLVGCVQAVILSVYLFLHSSIKGGRIFALLLGMQALHLFLVANDNQGFFMRFPHLLHVTWLMPAFYGPLILIFVRRITRHAPTLTWHELVCFVPALLLVVYHLPFLVQPAEAKRVYIADFALSVKDDFGFINAAVLWLQVFYFSAANWFYRRYQQRIMNYASNEEARLLWLKLFLRLIVGVLVFSIPVFYFKKYQVPVLENIYPAHFLLVIVLIYWSAYKLIHQPALFRTAIEESEFVSTATATGPSETVRQAQDQHQALALQITTLMEDEKIYRTQGLTLQDLATRLKSNKQYVSETINLVFEKNFYDYVNAYRLKEFTERLNNNEDKGLTLLGIANNAGFNSKATFNAVFKKHFGITPSEYQKMQAEHAHELLGAESLS